MSAQNNAIKECISKYIEEGLTDKSEIFTNVVDDLGVPRPTVRRVARDLRLECIAKVQVLQTEPTKIDKLESVPA